MSEQASSDNLIGANIQRYRAAKGLSQAELAEQLSLWVGEHVHQQTIQKIEKGTRTLKFTEAVALSSILEVELEDFAAGDLDAKFVEQTLRHFQQVSSMLEELREFAERLAPLLVTLALESARLKGPEATAEEIEALKRASHSALGINWGRDLNNALLSALRKHVYLADIKPELAAPTYAEILQRVAELPTVWPKLDESEA